MLDFDSLAEKQAQTLNQRHESWRAALWSEPFQKLTQSMSDGEVESLVRMCPTVDHLDGVVRYLTGRRPDVAPFTLLKEESGKAGKTLEEWVRDLQG
jgi:hypothetical protein